MSDMVEHPAHLDPSELGTKEYWDNYYQNDLDQDDGDNEEGEPADPADLESWFDDVDAPAKILEYLTSEDFPCSPSYLDLHRIRDAPRVLDLGTGNGSMLFKLRMEGRYPGSMVGVDYSQQSVDLARKLWKQYSSQDHSAELRRGEESMRFEKVDIIKEDPRKEPWWQEDAFDLVLDKGTFDAISLSSETIEDEHGTHRRIVELYPEKIVKLVTGGGYLLITSCNWTEDEIVEWFLSDDSGILEFYGKIDYPVYEFGGKKGSGVTSVCFHKLL